MPDPQELPLGIVADGLIMEALAPPAVAGRSSNTGRTYASQWRRFVGWCEGQGIDPLPCTPQVVSAYVDSMSVDGLAVSTVATGVVAIRAAHRDAGLPNPCDDPIVSAAKHRHALVRGRHQDQAKPLDRQALAAIEETACLQRRGRGGSWERPDTAQKRGLVDIAMCFVMGTSGVRVSEAAALTWGDVRRNPDGSGSILVRRSKTDQEGRGDYGSLTVRAMEALEKIRPRTFRQTDSVFGLSKYSLARRVGQAAEQAGLGPGYSGHSGRVGLAVEATQRGASAQEVAAMGRWKDLSSVGRYTRRMDVDKLARKYLED